MKPKVEAWTHRVRVISKTSKHHHHSEYSILGILLKLEWQYLQRTVPRFGTRVGPIEEALRETFFPTLFGGEEVDADSKKILGHSIKHGILGIPEPWS